MIPRSALALLVVGQAAGAVGCASHTQLAEDLRVQLDVRHRGRSVELRQSCFYGELYEENERWLLSPYPFDEIVHIVDLEGAPIRPQGQRGILPAGTRFVIERLEFPDSAALARRMLTTPRYNPWLVLAIGRPADPALAARSFVWVLPRDLADEAAVERELSRVVANEGEVTRFLETLAPTVRVAIAHKEPQVGMTAVELEAAMGRPRKVIVEADEGGRREVAWYPKQEAWMVEGRVQAVHPARALESPPPL